MCEDSFAERGVWYPSEHCNLHARHDFACAYAERCEPKNAIALALYQAL